MHSELFQKGVVPISFCYIFFQIKWPPGFTAAVLSFLIGCLKVQLTGFISPLFTPLKNLTRPTAHEDSFCPVNILLNQATAA